MRALVLRQPNVPPRIEDWPDPSASPGEVIVALKAAALNRRDFWITQGKYPGVRTPCVLGSDGAGVILSAPPGQGLFKGQEVLINPGLNWGPSPAAQASDFQILGMPSEGTLAQNVAVPVLAVHPRPPHLSWTQAAALPLAGLTAYRAVVTRGRLQAGERVLVTGIGGGVSSFALLFARALGATVVVTSSSPEKIERAQALGAAGGANYREPDWPAQLKRSYGAFDLIIDSAGGPGWPDLLDLAAPGGRIVLYGATAGPPPVVDLFRVFWKQLSILGTTMGSPADFQAMLDLVERKRLHPVVSQSLPLEQAPDALATMGRSPQFGKIAIVIACGAG